MMRLFMFLCGLTSLIFWVIIVLRKGSRVRSRLSRERTEDIQRRAIAKRTCIDCNYPLGDLPGDRCPECGRKRIDRPSESLWRGPD